jgi:hypothetical protein
MRQQPQLTHGQRPLAPRVEPAQPRIAVGDTTWQQGPADSRGHGCKKDLGVRDAEGGDRAAGAHGGGLWLVEADGLAVVDALVKEDPFWPTGLRRSVRVLEWSQVFRDGKRLI